MQTEKQQFTEQDVKAILEAFKPWIKQNEPDPKDYWDHSFYSPSNVDGQRAYYDDLREVRKDQRRAGRALRLAKSYPLNPEVMQDALSHAYSGRLEWKKEGEGAGHFSYCAGQNYDTETAQAAAAVLEEYCDKCRPKYAPPAGFKPYTVGEIKQAMKAAGSHFFDRSTMRFFRCRVLPSVYNGPGGCFFITSEQYDDNSPRLFTIRKFDPVTADIDTFGPFNELTRERAQRLARIAKDNPKAAAEAMAAGKVAA